MGSELTDGAWTARHQMSLNGKRGGFEFDDLRALARVAGLKCGRDGKIFDQVHQAVSAWPEFARQAGVPGATARSIARALRAERIRAK